MSGRLEIRNLAVEFGATRALDGVSLSVGAGESLGLVGESGSGKSTVAYATLGLLPAGATQRAGSILFDGQDLATLSPGARRALGGHRIGFVPQEPLSALNPTLKIAAQMDLVLARHLRLSAGERRRRALAMLGSVRLPNPERIAASYPFQLSGGQVQRVLLATLFALDPALIITDEPTTALDATVQAAILDLLRERVQQHGTGLLFISHNVGAVRALVDRVAVMRAGRIVETGRTADVLDQPSEAYTKALMAALPERSLPRTRLPVPAE